MNYKQKAFKDWKDNNDKEITIDSEIAFYTGLDAANKQKVANVEELKRVFDLAESNTPAWWNKKNRELMIDRVFGT